MEIPEKRKQGRPKRRFMATVRENMAEVTEEMQRIRANGDGQSVVATFDGRIQKWKKEVADDRPR